MGAPAFVSFPHFYAADPSLLSGVYGLHPEEEKHSFYMDLVPVRERVGEGKGEAEGRDTKKVEREERNGCVA